MNHRRLLSLASLAVPLSARVLQSTVQRAFRAGIRATVVGVGLAATLAALPRDAPAQSLKLLPGAEVLEGQPLEIVVEQLAPGSELRIVASRMQRGWRGPQLYQSQAVYRADGQGRVDLGRQAPVSGSYGGGADVRGLFWSMVPAPAGTTVAALQSATTERVHLQLFQGGRELLAQDLTLRVADANLVQRRPEEFPGARFAVPPTPGRKPAIILLGGSEGGSAAARSAPQLASLGYAVLGLPYYSPAGWGADGRPQPAELPTLPATFADIEISRLEQAREWLARQPEVDASRIAVYGVSKGAEFALAAASRMPWISGVVAVVPSDVVWEGWGPEVTTPDRRASFSWKGQPLAFVPYEGMDREVANAAQGKPMVIRRPMDAGRARHPARVPAARIEIERFAGPVLLLAGGDDQMWDSATMARNLAAARQAKGLPTTLRVYEQAGHAINGTGWRPTTEHNAGPLRMGGTPQADAQANADAWLQTQQFLKATLKP